MIDRFRYRRAPLVDPYQIKNERLFIPFLLATQGVFAAFGVLSILTEKTFAGSVNLFGGAVLALILLGYARFGSFRVAVGVFITIAMTASNPFPNRRLGCIRVLRWCDHVTHENFYHPILL